MEPNTMFIRNKKGKLEWEYLAAIALILLVIVIMMLFSETIKTTIMEKGREFMDKIIPDFLGQ